MFMCVIFVGTYHKIFVFKTIKVTLQGYEEQLDSSHCVIYNNNFKTL